MSLEERARDLGVEIKQTDHDIRHWALADADNFRGMGGKAVSVWPTAGLMRIDSQVREWIVGVLSSTRERKGLAENARNEVKGELEQCVNQRGPVEQRIRAAKQHLAEVRAGIRAGNGQTSYPERRHIQWRPYIAILIALAAGSFYFNRNAFQTAFSTSAAIIVAVVVAAGEVYATHQFGHLMSTWSVDRRRRDIFWAAVTLIGLVVMIVVIGQIRADYLSEIGREAETWEWQAMQFFFAMVGLTAAYLYANPHADAIEAAETQLAAAQHELEQLNREISALTHRIFGITRDISDIYSAGINLADELIERRKVLVQMFLTVFVGAGGRAKNEEIAFATPPLLLAMQREHASLTQRLAEAEAKPVTVAVTDGTVGRLFNPVGDGAVVDIRDGVEGTDHTLQEPRLGLRPELDDLLLSEDGRQDVPQ